MKKTLFVVALATMLVFAVAGSAFAVNRSGQQRLGAPVAGGESAAVPGTTTVPVPGAGTYTYMDWSLTLGDNGTEGNSPHGNYTTTTVKCVVCHAVHYAAPGNATVGSDAQTADTLLRVRADAACAYCHATANASVNGRPVYDGLGGPALTGALTGGSFNTGHYTGTNCNCCHSNVHGSGADDSVASLQGYLLLELPVTDMQGTAVDTANMLEAITAVDNLAVNDGFASGDALGGTPGFFAADNNPSTREVAVGVFCAECHNGAYATGTNGAGAKTSVRGSKAFTGHRLTGVTQTAGGWNADGSKSSGAFSGDIAWAASTNCKSCHDANDTYGNKAFPHSWGGTKMWLMSAADASATPSALPYGTAADSGYNEDRPQLSDGVCLKCHVASGGTDGVGITY